MKRQMRPAGILAALALAPIVLGLGAWCGLGVAYGNWQIGRYRKRNPVL